MADVTRRTFLKGVGGAAASGAVPGKPLLKFLLGQSKPQEAVSILHKLIQAREQGVDRFPVIYDALKRVGIDFDNPYEKTKLPEGTTFTDKPLYGRSELDDEIGLEQQIMIDAQGSYDPSEPQGFPNDASILGDYLDINLPPEFKAERTQESLAQAYQDLFVNPEIPHYEQTQQITKDREARASSLETEAFKDQSRKRSQHLFDTHPFYTGFQQMEEEEKDRREADISRQVIRASGISDEDLVSGQPLNPMSMITNMMPMGRIAKGVKNVGSKLFKEFMKRTPKKAKQPLRIEHKPTETFSVDPVKQADKVKVRRDG